MKNIAPVSLRIISGIIDFLVFFLPYLLVIWYISGSRELTELLNRSLYSLILFLSLLPVLLPLFSAWLIMSFGGTLGKIATGTQIVHAKGKTLTFWQAILRNYVGYMVSGTFIWLGFIWIAIDKERRGWHDMIADTYVVIKNQNGLVTGLLILVLLGIINFTLLTQSISNFQNQVPYYQQIFRSLVEDISKKGWSSPTVIPNSQHDAVEKVKNLPDVESFTNRVENSVVVFDHIDKTKNAWVIHVYENLPDHTATFNWYYVDKDTGEITREFDFEEN